MLGGEGHGVPVPDRRCRPPKLGALPARVPWGSACNSPPSRGRPTERNLMPGHTLEGRPGAVQGLRPRLRRRSSASGDLPTAPVPVPPPPLSNSLPACHFDTPWPGRWQASGAWIPHAAPFLAASGCFPLARRLLRPGGRNRPTEERPPGPEASASAPERPTTPPWADDSRDNHGSIEGGALRCFRF